MTYLTHPYERLNKLAKLNSASRYLEIGLAGGKTFFSVDVPYKVGVDPISRIDQEDTLTGETFCLEMTSDVFFSTKAQEHGLFDLIYIDGLHTFEQTFRDFCCSLRFSHNKTIWLLDDTVPTSWLCAHPDHLFVQRIRKMLRIHKRDWMGDAYKVVLAIHDFFPQFSYATFPIGGQTIVWTETRNLFKPTWNSLEKITRLGYREFIQCQNSHLNFIKEERIYSQLPTNLG